MSASPAAAPTEPSPRPARRRRALLWGVLVALLVVAQSMLVWLSIRYERSRVQEQVDATAAAAAADVKQGLARDLQDLQLLLWSNPAPAQWRSEAGKLLRAHSEMVRIERRDEQRRVVDAVDSPFGTPAFSRLPREEIDIDT
ncbi:MAG TPA: PAS domain-containing sensor histidine kinase, partial [Albitalea sp.]|nr:PAS domain-containing sensor histidine kinase [Albitalea sp.]